MTIIRNNRILVSHIIGRDTSTGIERKKYGYPTEYRLSLSSVSGELEIKEYGDRVFNMLKTVIDYRMTKNISEGDDVWVYDTPPAGADYKVVGVRPGNFKSVIYLEKKVTKCVKLKSGIKRTM
ncbi:hypothetical protein [Holdemania sp. Marseille-P2844]|uniref:hypothetical protein n=1 Tax=Holdemania sp. Marseille-P2844 TaxID=1852366 RepID=UPI000AF9BE1B|nr:hypothetical protein [Holdemania sp. Marseille-P2844]